MWVENKEMKRFVRAIVFIFVFSAIGQGQEVFDLFPQRPGSLTYWSESRPEPRPLRIHYLKVALDAPELEVITLLGEDPDGAGPAESQLVLPTELVMKFDALAAVNANAFFALRPTEKGGILWYEGLPVDIVGLAAVGGKIISPAENGRLSFWLDAVKKPHIGTPTLEQSVMQAVSDWQGPLLIDSRIVPDPEDRSLHPRTALGFDDSGSWLLLVVVDGRQPGFSGGVTLYELARILQAKGCTQSINLDGGGSSIMLIREPGKEVRAVNSPSDKKHRPVPVMLGVRRK